MKVNLKSKEKNLRKFKFLKIFCHINRSISAVNRIYVKITMYCNLTVSKTYIPILLEK